MITAPIIIKRSTPLVIGSYREQIEALRIEPMMRNTNKGSAYRADAAPHGCSADNDRSDGVHDIRLADCRVSRSSRAARTMPPQAAMIPLNMNTAIFVLMT
jgi:hypothetical protein